MSLGMLLLLDLPILCVIAWNLVKFHDRMESGQFHAMTKFHKSGLFWCELHHVLQMN